MNAPLDWPYCEEDLEEVYMYCTEVEKQSAVCDPRKARDRMILQQERIPVAYGAGGNGGGQGSGAHRKYLH